MGCPLSHHGTVPRGLESVPRSLSYDGRFGRMFRSLPPFEPSDTDLTRLAATMIEADQDEEDITKPSNNKDVPSGFTYLGQFIDHDLTFDPTSKLGRENDPDGLRDFRTPRFDLDSVYGSGPDDNPYLYDGSGKFLIGKNASGEDDLPRNSADPARALLGDPRNDENLIVSQLHLQFLKYHNRVLDEVSGDFDLARQMVRWHYQWIVIHDFLPRVVGAQVRDDVIRRVPFNVAVGQGVERADILETDLKFFGFKVQPFMPVEFSVAAYRFGHSMIRKNYALNDATDGNEIDIFATTGDDLRGFRSRPANRQIQWFRFFDFPENHDVSKGEPQHARAFDTLLVFGLGALPASVASNPSSLPARNLLRGKALGLPFGQAVARAMGISEGLIVSSDNPIYKFGIVPGYQNDASVPTVLQAEKDYLTSVFGRETPLWYYILKEAELLCGGTRLGPVGGRIVAEVFAGLLFADPLSYVNIAPGWIPRKGQFGCIKDGHFTMVDLIKHT